MHEIVQLFLNLISRKNCWVMKAIFLWIFQNLVRNQPYYFVPAKAGEMNSITVKLEFKDFLHQSYLFLNFIQFLKSLNKCHLQELPFPFFESWDTFVRAQCAKLRIFLTIRFLREINFCAFTISNTAFLRLWSVNIQNIFRLSKIAKADFT